LTSDPITNKDEDYNSEYLGANVAMTFGKIGDAKAVIPLIKRASRHTEDLLTCMSVRALGDIGDHTAVDTLIAILEDDKTVDCSHLRLETYVALRKLKNIKALEQLIEIVGNPRKTDYVLQEAAALALVELDDDRIELPLLRFFRQELESRVECVKPKDEKDQVLEALVKLIARLMDKHNV
jgi:HEAT repeat protein